MGTKQEGVERSVRGEHSLMFLRTAELHAYLPRVIKGGTKEGES